MSERDDADEVLRAFRRAVLSAFLADALLAFVAFAEEGGAASGLSVNDWRDMFNLRGRGVRCPGTGHKFVSTLAKFIASAMRKLTMRTFILIGLDEDAFPLSHRKMLRPRVVGIKGKGKGKGGSVKTCYDFIDLVEGEYGKNRDTWSELRKSCYEEQQVVVDLSTRVCNSSTALFDMVYFSCQYSEFDALSCCFCDRLGKMGSPKCNPTFSMKRKRRWSFCGER